jgi:hypothetical protein
MLSDVGGNVLDLANSPCRMYSAGDGGELQTCEFIRSIPFFELKLAPALMKKISRCSRWHVICFCISLIALK